jgi:hypothetical protein
LVLFYFLTNYNSINILVFSKYLNKMKKLFGVFANPATKPQGSQTVANAGSATNKPYVIRRRELSAQLGRTHYFPSLSDFESEACAVIDNRDFRENTPNNKLLILCEHASNDVKGFKIENQD